MNWCPQGIYLALWLRMRKHFLATSAKHFSSCSSLAPFFCPCRQYNVHNAYVHAKKRQTIKVQIHWRFLSLSRSLTTNIQIVWKSSTQTEWIEYAQYITNISIHVSHFDVTFFFSLSAPLFVPWFSTFLLFVFVDIFYELCCANDETTKSRLFVCLFHFLSSTENSSEIHSIKWC